MCKGLRKGCRCLVIELYFVALRLVDATGVHSEVLEVVCCSSLVAEANLSIAALVRACSCQQLTVCNFLAIRPGVRENSLRRSKICQLEAGPCCEILKKVYCVPVCSV